MYIYLWVHEDHWCSGVYVTCYEFVSYRISPIEVDLYKLSVCVSSVHNAPVYSLYNTRQRKKNKKKRKDECLIPVRLSE